MRSSKKLLSLLSKIEKQERAGFGGRMNAVQVVAWLLNKGIYFEQRYKRLSDNYAILNEIVRDLAAEKKVS